MNEVMPRPDQAVCWVVSDGRRGIENQALGLAEAVSRALPDPLHIERVTVRRDGFVALPRIGPPNLWIGCGRAAVRMPATFGDGMVLQTNHEYGTRAFLNGEAAPNEVVSVT